MVADTRRLASQRNLQSLPAPEARTRRRGRNTLSQQNQRDSRHDVSSQPGSSQRRSQRTIYSQPNPSTSNAGDFETLDEPVPSSQDHMSAHEEKQLATDVIKYLFVVDKAKKVIQRTHIVKNVLNGESRKFRQIIPQVQTLLSQIFGYRLDEFEIGKYILVNQIKNDILHNSVSQNERRQQILLFIVLTHIFMSDGSCTEDTIFNLLEELEIINGNNFHNYFGDVNNLISVEFVNQMYLEKSNPKREDPQKPTYTWGPRAKYELRPRSVLEFVSQVYGGQALKTWPQQFKAMQENEMTVDY